MVTVLGTEEFNGWFHEQPEAIAEAVARYVQLLEQQGVTLDHPYSSKVYGSKHGGMRELRVRHSSHAIRVFYAFDPKRQAIVLIAGDKAGNDRFYEEYTPKADALFDKYLAASK